ncbi:ATP-binding protein [Streptomyces sp. NPDC048269]|uniref:ATP-binding protein n=1 Tax=Streptomyces sp. NPDC048269 TaxID=3155753 RepID=UPI0034213374
MRELAPKLTRRIQFRARPSTRDLRHELFHALGLQGRPPAHAIEFDRMLRGALEETHVLVCDEAQWLSKMCFEYLRYLWDGISSDLTIVFTGGDGCFEMLQSEPMLESRVYAWQEIDPMPLEEVLTVVPAFHPVWADADPELIAMCDDEAAHGNFRAWAKITHHLAAGMKESGRVWTRTCCAGPTANCANARWWPECWTARTLRRSRWSWTRTTTWYTPGRPLHPTLRSMDA